MHAVCNHSTSYCICCYMIASLILPSCTPPITLPYSLPQPYSNLPTRSSCCPSAHPLSSSPPLTILLPHPLPSPPLPLVPIQSPLGQSLSQVPRKRSRSLLRTFGMHGSTARTAPSQWKSSMRTLMGRKSSHACTSTTSLMWVHLLVVGLPMWQ